MRGLRALAVALWMVVAGLTVWAIGARPAAVAHTALLYEPFLSYRLAPGLTADFLVPSGTHRVRLISRSVMRDDARIASGEPLDYAIDIAWLDDDRQPMLQHTFWESATMSRMPGPGLSPWQNAWLQDASDMITDDVVTLVPMASVLPAGGYLRITAPVDGADLYVRVYGEEVRSRMEAGLALFGPTASMQQGLLSRVGLPLWSFLDRGERRALARTVWRTLPPDAATREVIEPRWVMRSALRLSKGEQQLAWQNLDGWRSVAINLVGPAELKLSGQPEIAKLTVRWVGYADEDVVERAGSPVGLAGASRARVFEVPEGPGSMVFENPTPELIGPFWWTLDLIESDTLFGNTAAHRITDMAPPGRWPGEEMVLIGPEWNLIDLYRAWEASDLSWSGAWPPGGDVLQLQVRAVLADADDARPRTLRVTGWDALGRKVWSDAATFTPERAPFEGLTGTQRWISEPVRTWVPVDARIRRISVSTRDDLLLSMRTRGAPQGDDDVYPLPDERFSVRYGKRPPTEWRTLAPDGDLPEQQRARVAANVRLEPAGGGAGEGDAKRYYTTVVPREAPRPDRIWLVPPADPEDLTQRMLMCRFAPGTTPFDRSSIAVGKLEGVLSATLWTPSRAALGAPYRVALDGVSWQQGRLAQRVYRFRTGREAPRSRITFEAPAGSALWVRNFAVPGEACPDPAEGRRFWRLEPGEDLVLEVRRTLERQVFAVGALGPAEEARLWVHVDDGQTLTAGLHPSWTKKQRELILEPREGSPVAWPLDDPDTEATVLVPRGLVLASNLAGDTYRITLRNASAEAMYVRGLLETDTPPTEDYEIDQIGLITVDTEGGP